MMRNFKEALQMHKHNYELVTAWFGSTLNVDQISYYMSYNNEYVNDE
jgi:hypothetical protein